MSRGKMRFPQHTGAKNSGKRRKHEREIGERAFKAFVYNEGRAFQAEIKRTLIKATIENKPIELKNPTGLGPADKQGGILVLPIRDTINGERLKWLYWSKLGWNLGLVLYLPRWCRWGLAIYTQLCRVNGWPDWRGELGENE